MNRIKKSYDYLMGHYLAALLILSLITLTLGGVGNAAVVSVMGAALCLAGCMQGEAVTVDLQVLLPLLVFDVFSMASSLRACGTIAEGFAPTQTIFTVLYLIMAYIDDEERLFLRRLCVVWAGSVAALGIVQFTFKAMTARVGRLSGLLGNPNAFGIFLVVGWFALKTGEKERGSSNRLEPIILAALAMTLSMGSFLSMAAGLLLFFLISWREEGLRKALSSICQTLARAVVGMGVGLLFYVASWKTGVPWLCVLLALYLLAAALDWKVFSAFLQDCPLAAAALTAAGFTVAGGAVLLRPSATATFAERIEMMKSSMRYLLTDPLFGVGPYRWRLLDYNDGGIYFNTWHIHNLFLHIGVELGLAAMASLVLVTLRHFLKRGEPAAKCGSAAFLFHCMMDTGFFYEAIPSLTLLTAGRPRAGGQRLNVLLSRTVFALLEAVFFYDLLHLWL